MPAAKNPIFFLRDPDILIPLYVYPMVKPKNRAASPYSYTYIYTTILQYLIAFVNLYGKTKFAIHKNVTFA